MTKAEIADALNRIDDGKRPFDLAALKRAPSVTMRSDMCWANDLFDSRRIDDARQAVTDILRRMR